MTSPSDRFRQRAARRSAVAPGSAPFSSFLERHEERTRKSRSKRRMLVISVAVHVVVFGLLLLVSAWKVEELFGPSVEVKVMGSQAGEGEETTGGKKHQPRVNVSRAVGLRLVVTPQGARSEPRGDLEPTAADVREGLQSLVTSQLLPALRYPDAAKELRLRGAVTVLVDVDEQGAVSRLGVKEPCLHPLLCEASRTAVAAIGRWPGGAKGSAFAIPVDYRFAN